MRYLSLFSGIEAASAAWESLGWTPVAFAEIEPFPCKVLEARYPNVPNLGDVTKITPIDIYALGHIDVVIFGSPCQDLSVAGKRKGLAGERSGLFHVAVDIIGWSGARWALWENVPGAFSSNKGADFAAVVGSLAGLSGVAVPPKGWGNEGCAVGEKGMVEWATLDAQWFGVAQRRRRVFALADFGEWWSRPPLLLEREGLRGDSAPSREAGQSVAGTLSARSKGGGGLGTDFNLDGGLLPVTIQGDSVAPTIDASIDRKWGCSQWVNVGAGVLVPDVSLCLNAGGINEHFAERDIADALHTSSGSGSKAPIIASPQMIVRRLTPRECERLQGFADDRTLIATKRKVLAPKGAGPCVKQTVTATVVDTKGRHWVATNHCMTPQTTCARAGMATGVGYELCRSVCNQPAHAEVNVIKFAGKHAKGATLYLEGHTYACDSCLDAAKRAGIVSVVLSSPPGNADDGPRYKALGNSMAVPVIRWIGQQIEFARWF